MPDRIATQNYEPSDYDAERLSELSDEAVYEIQEWGRAAAIEYLFFKAWELGFTAASRGEATEHPPKADFMTEQAVVADCVRLHFGNKSLESQEERGLRFGEEGFELLQTVGIYEDVLHNLLSYVYSRPKGETSQEIGGVGTTLFALAESCGLRADECITKEVQRFASLPSGYFRKRHQAKFDAGISTINTKD